ncbi:MAG: hypothetical protein E7265_02155 [Lachnospiraceae bacterium]|nr:hypothetical protein [Lachnospiraceae bacterium]
MSVKDGMSKLIKTFGIPKLLLLVLAGVVLILLSVDEFRTKDEEVLFQNTNDIHIDGEKTVDDYNMGYTDDLEKKVEKVLARVRGIGKVDVLITLEGTAEKIVLKDTPYETDKSTQTGSGGEIQSKESYRNNQSTIFVNKDGDSIPYVVKEKEPVVKGVVVVSQNGDKAEIKKEIMEAIQVLFGIESHKIKVMKLIE